MRINDPNWYPCYINPTFGELIELVESKWDTCRILAEQHHGAVVDTDKGDIVIASGLGWTHSSQMDAYARHLGGLVIDSTTCRCGQDNKAGDRQCAKCHRNRYRYKNVPQMTSYILHQRGGIAYFNLEDASGSQYARFDEWEQFFYSGHREILRDLVRESGLSL